MSVGISAVLRPACVLGAMALATGSVAEVNVRDMGAKGDGKTLDTKAIQKAIDTCATGGGGTVRIPAGTYLATPIFLKSNITLVIETGATLLGSRDNAAYPAMTGRWEGRTVEQKASLVTGVDLTNIAITGGGTIDGAGDAWWGDYKSRSKRWQSYAAQGITTAPPGKEQEFKEAEGAKHLRPRLVNLLNCRDVTIRNITLKDSPSWTLHPTYCERVTFDNLTIVAPDESQNTDGIDVDSCRDVRISNCYISTGDDCIVIKSGKDEEGRKVGRPSENITITNCVMREGHAGVAIGSEMSGGVRNVAVSNCVFTGTQRGIRIKSQRGRGGTVENISYSNLVMSGITGEAISITTFYGGGDTSKAEPAGEGTPVFKNISMSDIRCEGAQDAMRLEGLVEMPIESISLANIRITAKRGMDCRNVRGLDLVNVRVKPTQGQPLVLTNVTGLRTDAESKPPQQ